MYTVILTPSFFSSLIVWFKPGNLLEEHRKIMKGTQHCLVVGVISCFCVIVQTNGITWLSVQESVFRHSKKICYFLNDFERTKLVPKKMKTSVLIGQFKWFLHIIVYQYIDISWFDLDICSLTWIPRGIPLPVPEHSLAKRSSDDPRPVLDPQAPYVHTLGPGLLVLFHHLKKKPYLSLVLKASRSK